MSNLYIYFLFFFVYYIIYVCMFIQVLELVSVSLSVLVPSGPWRMLSFCELS